MEGGRGVFLSQDEEGGAYLSSNPANWNNRDHVYGYALANPTRFVDVYGLAAAAASVCCDGNGGFTVCWSQSISNTVIANCIQEHEEDHINWLTQNPGKCANQCVDANGQPKPKGFKQWQMTEQDWHKMECRGYEAEIKCLTKNNFNTKTSLVLQRINKLKNTGKNVHGCNTQGW